MNFAKNRLDAGYSIRGLARHLDIPEQAIRRFERGEGIRPETAKVLADFHGVKVTDAYPVEPTNGIAA